MVPMETVSSRFGAISWCSPTVWVPVAARSGFSSHPGRERSSHLGSDFESGSDLRFASGLGSDFPSRSGFASDLDFGSDHQSDSGSGFASPPDFCSASDSDSRFRLHKKCDPRSPLASG
jgi:hypothetical protein